MKRLIIAVAALSLLGGTVAQAQPRYDRDRDGIPNRYDRDRDNDGIRNRNDPRPNNPRNGVRNDRDRDGIPNRYDRRDNRYSYGGHYYNRFRGSAYYHPRGYSYRRWIRGQRLPRAYFASPYYIDNWSYYHLAAPPRGYRYVRVGNDIVLAAIAGGLISSVIANAFY
jgi:Ni/Co efflux regulator RcnB